MNFLLLTVSGRYKLQRNCNKPTVFIVMQAFFQMVTFNFLMDYCVWMDFFNNLLCIKWCCLEIICCERSVNHHIWWLTTKIKSSDVRKFGRAWYCRKKSYKIFKLKLSQSKNRWNAKNLPCNCLKILDCTVTSVS